MKDKKKVSEARNARTKNVLILQGNYGYGWDDLCQYEDTTEGRLERKRDYQDYIENEGNIATFRTISRRVPNPDYVAPNADAKVESLKLKITGESRNTKRTRKATKESFDDVNNLDKSNRIGYGFIIRDMNSGYETVVSYANEHLAKQELTIAELMEDGTNYDYFGYDDDLRDMADLTNAIFEEIDWMHDIDEFVRDGKKVCVYGSDDGYVELINGDISVDLYL